MMADLGSDIATFPDLDDLFGPVTGTRAVAEALARRFETPRGGLFYDPDYGLDLRSWLNESLGQTDGELRRIAAAVEGEATKDERVMLAEAAASFDARTSTLTIAMRCQTGDGPFRLTLSVDRLTVAILAVE
jgi:hypothetical protein